MDLPGPVIPDSTCVFTIRLKSNSRLRSLPTEASSPGADETAGRDPGPTPRPRLQCSHYYVTTIIERAPGARTWPETEPTVRRRTRNHSASTLWSLLFMPRTHNALHVPVDLGHCRAEIVRRAWTKEERAVTRRKLIGEFFNIYTYLSFFCGFSLRN